MSSWLDQLGSTDGRLLGIPTNFAVFEGYGVTLPIHLGALKSDDLGRTTFGSKLASYAFPCLSAASSQPF